LCCLFCEVLYAQDLKEASSDKSAVLEGRLRGEKPAIETKLANGTAISVWISGGKNPEGQASDKIAKAQADSKTMLSNEGIKTVKVDFVYDDGKLARAVYQETTIIQHPTPSVASNKKEFVFTDGLITSPAAGTHPEMETVVNTCVSQIQKAFENHVRTR